MGLSIRRRLEPWGDDFGIRLSASEVARLGLKEGDEVLIQIRAVDDVDGLPSWPLGGGDVDKELEEEEEEWDDDP